MTYIILFFAFITGQVSILHRVDVAPAVYQIKKDAFGPLHIETVIEVYPTSIIYVGGSGVDAQLPPVYPHLLAIIHCHPDAAFPFPSAADKKTAHDLDVPVWTISRKAILVVEPDGKIKKGK